MGESTPAAQGLRRPRQSRGASFLRPWPPPGATCGPCFPPFRGLLLYSFRFGRAPFCCLARFIVRFRPFGLFFLRLQPRIWFTLGLCRPTGSGSVLLVLLMIYRQIYTCSCPINKYIFFCLCIHGFRNERCSKKERWESMGCKSTHGLFCSSCSLGAEASFKR